MTQMDVADLGKRTIKAERVREMYGRGMKATRAEQQRYWVNQSFLLGEQWVYINQARNQIVQANPNPKRVRVMIPRLRPESRRLIAKLLRRKLVFEVIPTAGDDATVRAAKDAEGVLEDTARSHDWEKVREEHAWATWVGGTGMLCLDWDPSAGKRLGYDEVTKRVIGEGDIRTTALTITEVATEPGTTDIEHARWWIKAQALPANEVQQTYGLKKKPKADATAALSPYQQRIMTATRGEPAFDLSLVLTYYERPSRENPDGMVAIVIGGETVSVGKWPFPFKDRLNVVAGIETFVLKRWTGDSILSDAIPIQTALNASWSNILEHQKHAANARLQVPDYSIDRIEELTDQAGEIIPYNPAMGESKWLSPPQMPDWWLMQPEKLRAEMDDVLGIHDISRGMAPKNVESGAALSILQEQDETPIGGLARNLAAAWGRYASMVLEVYADKVTTSRKARLDYVGGASETKKWKGTDLAGQTTAFVPFDSVAPVSDAVRKTQGFMLWDRGAFNDPNGKPDPTKLAAFIDGPGQSFIEDTDPDVARARRENHEMALGGICVPQPWDDHAKHIAELNRFRKSARYEQLDKAVKEVIAKHAQAHENLAAAEAGKLAGQAEAHPALAGAADAHEPAPLDGAMPGAPASSGPEAPPDDQSGSTPPGQPDPQGLAAILQQAQGVSDQAGQVVGAAPMGIGS